MNQHSARSMPAEETAPAPLHRKSFSYRLMAYLVVILAAVFGQVSLLALGLFLYHGSFYLLPLDLPEAERILMNTGLCLMFFLQHSLMVRKGYRKWLARRIREEFHPALYSIFSGVTLLVMIALWQRSDIVVASADGAVYWLLRGGYFLSIAGFLWGNLALGSFDSFGLNFVLNHIRGVKPQPLPFVVRGPYRWVRHPLYFCSLLMIWSCPVLSLDRLLFDVLFTVWTVIGMMLEERDLLRSFGQEYQRYREKVPILIPLSIRPGV